MAFLKTNYMTYRCVFFEGIGTKLLDFNSKRSSGEETKGRDSEVFSVIVLKDIHFKSNNCRQSLIDLLREQWLPSEPNDVFDTQLN